ncbi:heat-inducible transcriptional repressor HrcA [Defluviicoccus vanus]|uniref:Heat-inducible transcription repressor HrcA n=1 Tax=Defluviicoccus vanus TaxID=111831 RepID=A0A7H1N0V0_9PROT|nr:heat-inducible transcriptional repressor HrcA [Defluviicoccus vanus]QNT69336.1 heat-inducible transcriptional repressor HrcA [Defluviicoccus vanus]
MIGELSARSREIFRQVVDAYLETGEPIGSRTLSRRLTVSLSPATIRNVMADLEESGLLFSPHASAGRLPTEAGLRLFVDGLLGVGALADDDRRSLSQQCAGSSTSIDGLFEAATTALSGLARCAGLVTAPKTELPLKHIEVVSLSPSRALVVIVTEAGVVENRVIETPPDLPPSALVEASNFLSARLVGRTIVEARTEILAELQRHTDMLDQLTGRVVESGLATWGGDGKSGQLIVRGQAHLLDDVQAIGELEQIRALFALLETKETMLQVLSMVEGGEGVQIFIGASSPLFNVTGCSMIVSPYRDGREKIIGAIGVIGPTRMNYARIIPMVDYTAKLIGRMIG